MGNETKNKWVWKEFILPFLIMLGLTGIGIAVFMFTIGLGSNIAPTSVICNETTKPTSGRMAYIIFSFAAFVVTAFLAEKFSKQEKIYPAFYTGFLSGMFLWQAVGEGSWHFGYQLGESYLNFFRIESAGSLFLVITFALFTGYVMKNRLLGFGVLCTILSFLCNWYGHFVSEGTYPIVSGFMSVSTWYATIGLSAGIIISAAAIILACKKFTDTKGHLLCSMLLYIGISIVSFGFIE